MKTYYHTTLKSRLASILENGLVPNDVLLHDAPWEFFEGVCLSRSPQAWQTTIAQRHMVEPEELITLQVNLPDEWELMLDPNALPLEREDRDETALYSPLRIPATCLSVCTFPTA